MINRFTFTTRAGIAASITIAVALSVSGCKQKSASAPPVSPVSGATAATQPEANAAAARNDASFDINSVPLSSVKLPPFPYLDWPSKLEEKFRAVSSDKAFDRFFVIAGRTLRPVEGRISERQFPNDPAGLSAIGSQRNYAEAIKTLGGVKVNTIQPTDPQWVRQQGGNVEALFKQMRLAADGGDTYDMYLIRTLRTNIWIAFSLFDGGLNTRLLVAEEKALEQTVGFVAADTMAASLQQQGHVALYLSFDTDRDVIRAESAPVVDEVVKLLRTRPELRLKVEGHTDNVGDKAHNQTLSLARAQSVVRAITAQKIDPARLSAVGLGAGKPLADNESEGGRSKNRRVELVRS
jgi:OOP family OmpA-OmpF porin